MRRKANGIFSVYVRTKCLKAHWICEFVKYPLNYTNPEKLRKLPLKALEFVH